MPIPAKAFEVAMFGFALVATIAAVEEHPRLSIVAQFTTFAMVVMGVLTAEEALRLKKAK